MQSVERAFAILRALAMAPAGVTELSDRVDLPKSTVARMLATLVEQGAVEQREAGGAYRLGASIADLAGGASVIANLVAVAKPHLEVLVRRSGEAAGLSLAEGYEAYYVAQVESPNPVQVRDWTGARIPLHAVSSGQVFLAHWPEDALAGYLARPLARFTDNTLVDPARLRRRLAQVRKDGHCWTDEEYAEGITSVAAPVFDGGDRVVAVAHVHGPSYRFPPRRGEARLGRMTIEAGKAIGAAFGTKRGNGALQTP